MLLLLLLLLALACLLLMTRQQKRNCLDRYGQDMDCCRPSTVRRCGGGTGRTPRLSEGNHGVACRCVVWLSWACSCSPEQLPVFTGVLKCFETLQGASDVAFTVIASTELLRSLLSDWEATCSCITFFTLLSQSFPQVWTLHELPVLPLLFPC